MYLSVDIGGTKTLIAVYSEDGEALNEVKFPTGDDYHQLLREIKSQSDAIIDNPEDIKSVAVAVPVPIDYKTGVSRLRHKFDWPEANVLEDLSKLFTCPVAVENDANLAALGEAILGSGKNYQTVLYVTISTGIGTGIISDHEIVPVLAPSEGGFAYLYYDGQQQIWENFGSGKAFTERYGKMGSEVNDPEIWKEYATTALAAGFMNLISLVEPDVVVVGGGMGAHLEKYRHFLMEELDKLNKPLKSIELPDIVLAELPDEAVVHGGYLLAKKIAQ